MPICLLAGTRSAVAAAELVTLVWTHSVEKVEWRETWAATPAGLVAVEARVKGSGAGMEPGPEARLVDGWWVWRPDLPPQATLSLARSGVVADWRLCSHHACMAPVDLLPGLAADEPVRLAVCRPE
ncbi:hypothetical protein ABB55_26390 [Prosthecomicrobium hirschii]|uniref:DUF1850 domain-containing protein n=1 Tax=Prosthecodimorpha hirschii TaxID=665126 RepID=A0A0P6VVQ7_9HYPH|nr:DUF1850 domain-containing protein [Prosthecomicrobium hirschii]KPL55325.1 hypothetical protein ABB55_26390 [Prosthecomicrobium hirschii]